MKQRRVVVTGIGVVTPIGTGRERLWTNLLEGRAGIGQVFRHECLQRSSWR
jgi:3-oxoacyl-[acyl-carrier-protein] synthase II